jgi:hypothetical protein
VSEACQEVSEACQEVSEGVRMCQDVSGCVRMCQAVSEGVRTVSGGGTVRSAMKFHSFYIPFRFCVRSARAAMAVVTHLKKK